MSAELKIREALDGIAPCGPFHKSGRFVDIDETEDWPAMRVQVLANKLVGPKVAQYIAACSPAAVTELLAELDRLRAPGAPQEAAPELLRGWKRYEKARKLSPRQWAELHARNLAGETFDDMIDALPEPATPVPEAAAVPAVGQEARYGIDCYYLPTTKRGGSEVKVQRTRQMNGPDKWSVRLDGNCLNKRGDWEWEPMPSSRDDEFLNRCRFETLEEALDAALAGGDGGEG